jgi:transglutaminase-like putative cysteine protease
MHIKVGYELSYECPQPTPMILMLNIHSSRVSDIIIPDLLAASPPVTVDGFHDIYGNWCSRIVAPQGTLRLTANAVVKDAGQTDPIVYAARQQVLQDLPDDVLLFLLPSRFCETDTMQAQAWSLFDRAPTGWGRVQAICDYVHQRIEFGYAHARVTKSAWQVLNEGKGVCRDFAHLAIAFCRCMNIPARYCTGYLSDVGLPPPYATMDFAAWFEAYLDGEWYTFDPRNNVPRAGRILIARGRDAADVAIATTFGPNTLTGFKVWTEEIADSAASRRSFKPTR